MNRLGKGEKMDVYYHSEPNDGAGVIYKINDEWSVYGGVHKNSEKYGPEFGVNFSPKCSIF